jgi:alpha-tubulin suppressor-like RCC1 family protein
VVNESPHFQESALDEIKSLQTLPFFSYPLIAFPLKSIKSTFISKVACGLEHALLLTSSGFVYAMGRNSFGQLGGTV